MEQISEVNRSESLAKCVNLMERNMDLEVDPTEDFISYASRRFSRDNYNERRGEYHPYYHENTFKRIFDNELIDDDLIKLVRDFHSSIPTTAKEFLTSESLREFCGGFPAFHSNWSVENFNWIRAIGILSAMDFETIFYTNLQYLDSRKIIVVSAVKLQESWLEYVENDFESLELTSEQLSDMINDVNYIKEKLDRIAVEDDDGTRFERVRVVFEELREDLFDYELYFQNVYGETLRPDDILHLSNDEPGYLDRYLNIFLEAPPKVVANYIAFVIACTIREYYNPFFLVEKYFAPALLAIGSKFHINTYEIEQRKNLSLYLSKFCKNELGVNDNDFEIFNVNRDSQILEYIESYFTYQKIKDELEGIEINPNNFFQNIVNLRGLISSVSMKKYLAYRDEESILFYDAKNLIEYLILNHSKPVFYHFSSWGIDKCKELMFSLDYTEMIYEYVTVLNSIKEQIRKYNFHEEDNLDEDWFDYELRVYLITIEALRIAFKCYTTWLKDNEQLAIEENEIVKRLNLDCKKAFFVAFVQNYCTYELPIPMHLALVNSEFSSVYNCKSDSRMFLSNKCEIKWNIS